MPKDIVTNVLAAYGETRAGEPFTLDENDYIALQPDAGPLVNIDYFEDDDVLVFYTTIGDIPEEHRLAVCEELLQANFFWKITAGATLAMTEDGQAAVATLSLSCRDLTVDIFAGTLARLARLTVLWNKRLQDIAAGPGAGVANSDIAPEQGAQPVPFA